MKQYRRDQMTELLWLRVAFVQIAMAPNSLKMIE